MTEFESRRKGTKAIAWIVVIALVVGVGGGWLISVFFGGDDNASASSVYVTTANGGSLIEDNGNTLLTLKAVGNTVVKVDRATEIASPTDAAEFFKAWNDTFGDEPRNAVVAATTSDGDVQLVLKVTNATFSDIGYVLQFDADVVSGPAEARDLSDVTLVIDAD
jgi:hypothetical protein